jgi:hypothetical protein
MRLGYLLLVQVLDSYLTYHLPVGSWAQSHGQSPEECQHHQALSSALTPPMPRVITQSPSWAVLLSRIW